MSGEPKPDPALLKDIVGGAKLKHTETQEKNPLPSVGGKPFLKLVTSPRLEASSFLLLDQ